MTILGFLFLVLVIYLGYRLLFDFILPIYRTTKRVRRSFREMQERMNQHTQQYHQEEGHAKQNTDTGNRQAGVGEYIDFEEIKE